MTPELKKQIRNRNGADSDADILLDMVECLEAALAEATQSRAALREALRKIKNLSNNAWLDTANTRWLFERIHEHAALALDAEQLPTMPRGKP